MNRRPRVLLLQPYFGRTGAYQTRELLTKYLDPRRHDVEVCCMGSADTQCYESMLRRGMKVHVLGLPLGRARRSVLDPRITRKLAEFIRRGGYDVAQALAYVDGVQGRLAARAAGVPVSIVEVRGEYPLSARYWLSVPLDFALARQTQAIVANSEAVATQLRRILRLPRRRCFAITNAVDPDRMTPLRSRQEARSAIGISDETVAVAAVGRLSWEKGQSYLLKAFARLNTRSAPARLFVVGEGEDGPHLQSLAQRLGIAPKVAFLGWRSDVADILSAMDIVVLPSLREGWGNAAAEAIWMGLPVIASSVGGLPEVLAHGTGLLVPPRDAPRLAEALRRLINDPAERLRLREPARQRARLAFSPQRFAQRYQDLWDELLVRATR